jgi:hypothetical protein
MCVEWGGVGGLGTAISDGAIAPFCARSARAVASPPARVRRARTHDHLVEELVQQDEVLPDGLLRQQAAVVLEDLGDAVEELEGEGRRDVELGRRDEVDAALLDEEVVDPVDVLQGVRAGGGEEG